jgi:hypothetical protein
VVGTPGAPVIDKLLEIRNCLQQYQ